MCTMCNTNHSSSTRFFVGRPYGDSGPGLLMLLCQHPNDKNPFVQHVFVFLDEPRG